MDKFKMDEAYKNINFLLSKNINFFQKIVLDVGFGLGYNSYVMKNTGATVYGVEPDKESYKYAIQNNLVDFDKVLNCSLQNIPEELYNTFDIATIFLYCMGYSERLEISKMLSLVLKSDGIAIIGIWDSDFIIGDGYSPNVAKSFLNDFKYIQTSFDSSLINRYFIYASNLKMKLNIEDSLKISYELYSRKVEYSSPSLLLKF